MSYCKIGPDSDVYVFRESAAHWVCGKCQLRAPTDGGGGEHGESSIEGMQRHLREHRSQGHRVPEAAFERLEREATGPYVLLDGDRWPASTRADRQAIVGMLSSDPGSPAVMPVLLDREGGQVQVDVIAVIR